MFVSYWDGADYSVNMKKIMLEDKNEEILMQMLLEKNQAVLSTIEIETINRCNNDCSFCPANRHSDIRQMKKMDEALFKKIIDELADMDYKGRVSLFSNGEPLLDTRIISFAEYTKEKLPDAYISLFTNGILLDEEKYVGLIKNLDYLRINNYNDNLVVNENIQELIDKEIDEGSCLVEVEVRKKTQVLLNRGGLSPNNDTKITYNSPCILPFIQMVIRPDGSVSRCCQDVYGNTTLGNVAETSVKEVWNGEEFVKYRKQMLEGKRQEIQYCNVCDIHGLFSRYPGDWEYEYYAGLLDLLVAKSKEGKCIALCCVQNATVLAKNLHMKGVDNICVSYLKEDFKLLLDRGDFVVWGGNMTDICQLDEEIDKTIGKDYIVYSRELRNYMHFESSEDRSREKEEIISASKEGRLVIFGAGISAKRILDAIKISNYMIVDNNKIGEVFLDKVIEAPEKISDINNPMILVTPFDYTSIVKQLNDMKISTLQICFGYRFLR